MLRLKIVLFFLCVAVWEGYSQKIHVVSVGIADYKEIRDLRLTENDVRVFNGLMSSQGAEITTLLGSQATHAKVIASIRGAFARAKKEDTMIFFFSGHGYEGGFCCWDMSGSSPALSGNAAARNVQDRNRLAATNKYYGGLSYAEMQILFRNCRAGKKIVIADACFSGGLHKGNQLGLSVQAVKDGDVLFFLSSRMDETSLEMGGGTNGLFTYYLAKALCGEADSDQDRQITVKEMFGYVYRSVVAYANEISHAQHPVLWGKFDETLPVFYLTK